jgi:hypothetical protein
MNKVAAQSGSRSRPVQLSAVATAADLVAALGAILAAVAAGELTPDEGSAVAGLIESHHPEQATAEDRALLAVEEWQSAFVVLIEAAGGLAAVVKQSYAA